MALMAPSLSLTTPAARQAGVTPDHPHGCRDPHAPICSELERERLPGDAFWQVVLWFLNLSGLLGWTWGLGLGSPGGRFAPDQQTGSCHAQGPPGVAVESPRALMRTKARDPSPRHFCLPFLCTVPCTGGSPHCVLPGQCRPIRLPLCLRHSQPRNR